MMRRTAPQAIVLEFVAEAAQRRTDAEIHLRRALVAAREADLPLGLIADAAGLSLSRVQAIVSEEEAARERNKAPDSLLTHAQDVLVVAAGRAAANEFLEYAAYVCQRNRSFRDVGRMGFYRRRRIEPYFPEIRYRVTDVEFSREHADHLQASGDPLSSDLGDLIDAMLRDGRRSAGESYQVFLLTPADDPRTLVLEQPIHHGALGRGSAWTQGTRYTSEASLRTNPRTTDDIA